MQSPEQPNSKPVGAVTLADGRVRHTLQDGRVFTVKAQPCYRLEYVSSWVGAKPGDTYFANVSLAGLSQHEECYETWNFDIGEMRTYAFAKTVSLIDLSTGDKFTGTELRVQLLDLPF